MKTIIFPPTRFRAWLQVIILTILIFSTLSIVRPIVNFLKKTGTLDIVVWGSLIVFCFFLVYFIKQAKLKSMPRYIVLGILLICYGLSLQYLIVAPEERIHFIEYGMLSLFFFRAFSFDIRKKWLNYALTLSAVSLVGYLDEVVQYILPNRVYDIRDVGLNSLAGFLMLIFILLLGSDS